MRPGQLVKILYIISIITFLYDINIPQSAYTGNFLLDVFSGLKSNNKIEFTFEVFNLLIIPMSYYFFRKSEGFSKSHFRNIFQINIIGFIIVLIFYRNLWDESYQSDNPFFILIFLIPIFSYIIWRLFRGAYLAFNDREISKF